MSADPVFRVHSLQFSYEDRPVLDLDGLEIDSGSVTVLVGPNGSGKTTLLKLLNGLLPAPGAIFFLGEALDSRPDSALRRESVLVHQDPYLFDGTVSSNVAYGLKLRGEERNRIRTAVDEALTKVGLSGLESRRARKLSGGERQRVAIARALALRPRVLLLDEPTANVDAQTIELLEQLIFLLSSEGTTIIVSTHHPSFAYRLGTDLVHMADGRVIPGEENIFKGEVDSTDESFTYFRSGTQILRCPAREGRFIAAVLPMDDVILSRDRIATSAQNQLTGTVRRLERNDHIVRVTVDCGIPVQAMITEYSVESLNVAPGEDFYVAFKASAVKLY